MSHSVSCESTLSMSPIDAAGIFFENGERNLDILKDMILNNNDILDKMKGRIDNIIKIDDFDHDDGVCATNEGPESEFNSTVSNNDKKSDDQIYVQHESKNVIAHQKDAHALHTPISTPPRRVSCTPSPGNDPLRDETFCISPGKMLDVIDQHTDCKEEFVDLKRLISPSPSAHRLQGIYNDHSVPTTIEHEGEKCSAKGIRSSFDAASNFKLRISRTTLTDQQAFSTEITKHEPTPAKRYSGPSDCKDQTRHLFSHEEEQKELENIEVHRSLLVGLRKRLDSELESMSSSLSFSTRSQYSDNSTPRHPHLQADTTGNTLSSETLPSIQDYSCYHRFVSFKKAMTKSRASHNQLVSWDRKQGMKSSHCKTMTASKFSRKRSIQFIKLRLKNEQK